MSQHDYNLADQPGASFRTDLNNALGAIQGNNSGATAPTYTLPYMFWADTASGYLKVRNAANNAWVTVRSLSSAFMEIQNGGTGATTETAARVALGVETATNGSTKVASGTEAQRDISPQPGYFRFNLTDTGWEGWDGTAWVNLVKSSAIGVSVQAYDADTAKTDVAQTWVATQRTSETTDNDGSFDLAAAADFACTPTGAVTLTFTNIPATPLVQKGRIIFNNAGGYAVAQHANTKIGTAALARLAVAGTYNIVYTTSNGLSYCSVSEKLV